MNRALRVTRAVTQEECHWLDSDVYKDDVVYEFKGHTYGCINHQSGMAVTWSSVGKHPFFEVPKDAVEYIA